MDFAPGAGARIRRSSVIDRVRAAHGAFASICRFRLSVPAPSLRAHGVWRSGGRPRAHVVAPLALCLLGACATPAATDVGGRWRPVNRFADAPQAIPLQQAYVYQASPADGTLKTMLSRWARDGRMTLSYQHPNDYTLHGPVGGIRTTSLEQAAAALSAAYADHGVQVTVERTRILVSQRVPGGTGADPGRDG